MIFPIPNDNHVLEDSELFNSELFNSKLFNSKLLISSLILFSERNKIPYFDLYNILGGEGSFIELKKKKMTSNDKIHFRANGYKMQGKLFSNALLKAYKRYKKRTME